MGSARYPKPVIILTGAAVLMSIGMGMRQSLGLFLPPVAHDLAIPRAISPLPSRCRTSFGACRQTPVGMIADKWGMRPALVFGVLIYIAGLLVMAAATGTPALVVSGALVGSRCRAPRPHWR